MRIAIDLADHLPSERGVRGCDIRVERRLWGRRERLGAGEQGRGGDQQQRGESVHAGEPNRDADTRQPSHSRTGPASGNSELSRFD